MAANARNTRRSNPLSCLAGITVVVAMTGYIVTRCLVTLETIFESYNAGVSAAPKAFKLFAGHPALELVNTLDLRFSTEAIELLPAYGDLLRLLTQLRL